MILSSYYAGLITSEHANQPNFVSVIVTLSQGSTDTNNLCNQIPTYFDLDKASGDQLDTIGEWVGLSRVLSTPLANVYFSWDATALLGWESGSWQAAYDSNSGLIILPDDAYRQYIRSKIAANNWDGTIPGALAVYRSIFGSDLTVIIQDNQDMTLSLGFVGTPLTAIQQALLLSGHIPLKPAGVAINVIALPPAVGPLFAWDVVSSVLTGWETGQWAINIQPT
jgi:hypothetical protein